MSTSRLTDTFLKEIAHAVQGTLNEKVGKGIGFILVLVDQAENGSTDFQYISNIPEDKAVKELMTQVVTLNETKN